MPTVNDPNGTPAKVNNDNQLETYAVTHSNEHWHNIIGEEAYQVPFAVNPGGADDCFFYLKNNSADDIVVEAFSYTSSAAEEIYVEIANTGTAVLTDGTAQIPANCNAGSGKTANVTCWSGTADEGVDITGLAGGREIDRIWIIAAADNKLHNFEMDLIIPQNQIFSLWCVGGDTNIRGTVHFYFHPVL